MSTHCLKTLIPAAAVFAMLFTAGPARLRADVLATLDRVGNPIWRPADINLFAAPADTFDAFLSVTDSILVATAPPSNPPYDDIITAGLASAGYQDASIFLESNINGQPSGVYYAYVLEPDPGETGSSLDFASGPIIPNRLFPLTDDTDLLRNGIIVDPVFDAEYSAVAGFDGYSHTTAFNASHAGFFPPGTELSGTYEFRTILRDAESNGWNITVPFEVVPEPSGMTLCLILLISAAGVFRFVHTRANHRLRENPRLPAGASEQ
jgi:hypothetical protein